MLPVHVDGRETGIAMPPHENIKRTIDTAIGNMPDFFIVIELPVAFSGGKLILGPETFSLLQ